MPGGTEVTKSCFQTTHWRQWPPSKALGLHRESKLTKTSYCIVRTKHRSLTADMMAATERRESPSRSKGAMTQLWKTGVKTPAVSLALTRIQSVATNSQRCLNGDAQCAGISKPLAFRQQVGFWLSSHRAPSGIFYGFAKRLRPHSQDWWQPKEVCKTQLAAGFS